MVLMIRQSLMFMVTAALGCTAVNGQFASSLEIDKRQHIVGEAVMATLRVTNHSGRTQVFANQGRVPWLTLMCKTSNGSPVNARRHAEFGPMKIEPGQTLAKKINIADYFLLDQSGNFAAYAVIRPPNSGLDGTTTNRVFFEQRAGRVEWAQKVGNSENMREYRLLRFRGDSTSQLYFQVEDDHTGRLLRTYSLGDALLMRKPMFTIDRDQCMHVLFLHSPVVWLHYCIDTEGEIISRDIHKRSNAGDPKLVTLPNGAIEVQNSILFDPVAAAKERAKIHNITDRPNLPDEL